MREHLDAATFQIMTAYGRANLVLTSGTTIYLDANTNGATRPEIGWTVNGVRYFVNAHLMRMPGAGWMLAASPSDPHAFHAVYISRAGFGAKGDASESARAKIRAEITHAVNEWVNITVHAAEALNEAERRKLNNDAACLEEGIVEIEKKLAEKGAELEEVQRRMTWLSHTGRIVPA